MYTYLKQHPEIFVSVLKEPHFFGSDLSRQPHTVRDQDVYLSLFADAGPKQKAGEGSVWYLRSRLAAAEIKSFCPEARILIMLRNPVEMIHSLHSLYLRTGNEEIEDVEAAVAAQADRKRGRRIPATTYFPEGLLYTENAMFSEMVQRFLEVFGGAQVWIIPFDDFTANTAKSYRETLKFLGVDPGFAPNYDTRAANVAMRMEVLAQLRKLPPELRRVMRGSGRRHLGPRPAMRPEFRRQLQQHFAADVERLSVLIGRDLRPWCDDERQGEEPR